MHGQKLPAFPLRRQGSNCIPVNHFCSSLSLVCPTKLAENNSKNNRDKTIVFQEQKTRLSQNISS